jgi:predicted PurR-regulated permease PerM
MTLVGPTLSSRKEALRTLDELQHQMHSYFRRLMATNAPIGLAIWGTIFALRVENPGFWGAWGVLLAAPLTCVMKVVCNRVPALERFAVVLSP